MWSVEVWRVWGVECRSLESVGCGVWKFGGWGVKCGSVMRVWRMGV